MLHLFIYFIIIFVESECQVLLFVNEDAQIFNQNHHVAVFRLSSLPF